MASFIVDDLNTKFILSFVKVGLAPDMGLYQLLLDRVPLYIVKEWISFSKVINAKDLYEWGVVNRIINGDVLEGAISFINQLTNISPLNLKFSKKYSII